MRRSSVTINKLAHCRLNSRVDEAIPQKLLREKALQYDKDPFIKKSKALDYDTAEVGDIVITAAWSDLETSRAIRSESRTKGKKSVENKVRAPDSTPSMIITIVVTKTGVREVHAIYTFVAGKVVLYEAVFEKPYPGLMRLNGMSSRSFVRAVSVWIKKYK